MLVAWNRTVKFLWLCVKERKPKRLYVCVDAVQNECALCSLKNDNNEFEFKLDLLKRKSFTPC